jgi:hypothetical protein
MGLKRYDGIRRTKKAAFIAAVSAEYAEFNF